MSESTQNIDIASLLDILTEPIESLKPGIISEDYYDIKPVEIQFAEYAALIKLDETTSIILGVDKNAANLISPSIFGFPIEENDEEMFLEFAKELLNIISGNCKTRLGRAGIHFGFSLPEIPDKELIINSEINITKRKFDYENHNLELVILRFNK